MKRCFTIMMLCLSLPTIAETYVCTTEKNSFLSNSVAEVFDSGEVEGWVVDMDLGFRKLKVDENDYRGTGYRGGCQKSEFRITCSYEDTITLEHIWIDLLKDSYTYSSHSLGSVVLSSLGVCNGI